MSPGVCIYAHSNFLFCISLVYRKKRHYLYIYVCQKRVDRHVLFLLLFMESQGAVGRQHETRLVLPYCMRQMAPAGSMGQLRAGPSSRPAGLGKAGEGRAETTAQRKEKEGQKQGRTINGTL